MCGQKTIVKLYPNVLYIKKGLLLIFKKKPVASVEEWGLGRDTRDLPRMRKMFFGVGIGFHECTRFSNSGNVRPVHFNINYSFKS